MHARSVFFGIVIGALAGAVVPAVAQWVQIVEHAFYSLGPGVSASFRCADATNTARSGKRIEISTLWETDTVLTCPL